MYFFKFFFFIFFLFLYSCSNLVPLYVENEESQNIISNINILPIEGRYGVFLKNRLEETFGITEDGDERNYYKLEATINVGTTVVESFNVDGTASRFGAMVNVEYRLFNDIGRSIISDSLDTNATYNSKSSGYDFGNKASERAAIKRNIGYNVKQIYPKIYNAIKYKTIVIRNFPPLIGIEDHKIC